MHGSPGAAVAGCPLATPMDTRLHTLPSDPGTHPMRLHAFWGNVTRQPGSPSADWLDHSPWRHESLLPQENAPTPPWGLSYSPASPWDEPSASGVNMRALWAGGLCGSLTFQLTKVSCPPNPLNWCHCAHFTDKQTRLPGEAPQGPMASQEHGWAWDPGPDSHIPSAPRRGPKPASPSRQGDRKSRCRSWVASPSRPPALCVQRECFARGTRVPVVTGLS